MQECKRAGTTLERGSSELNQGVCLHQWQQWHLHVNKSKQALLGFLERAKRYHMMEKTCELTLFPYISKQDTKRPISENEVVPRSVRISDAALGGKGDIVYVLPLPVCPYAKHVALPALNIV